MISSEPRHIWLYSQPTDMRKSFTGLIALARQALNEDPQSGDWFVFINRRKTHMKVLYFDGSGYCIWLKRLEQGQFNYRVSSAGKSPLSSTQLRLLLEGIEVKKYRQYKRFRRSESAHSGIM
mgnify:CR=1 FL=1